MTIVDTKSGTPFRVRVNRSGRRTFSRDYKLEIVEECLAPGASVAAVALSHRINANQVRKWIVQHRAGRLCPKPERHADDAAGDVASYNAADADGETATACSLAAFSRCD